MFQVKFEIENNKFEIELTYISSFDCNEFWNVS